MEYDSDCRCWGGGSDNGPVPFVGNAHRAALQNQDFRRAYWTGNHLQMTLMHIPARGEIGLEVHPNTDQYLHIESGRGCICMGESRDHMDLHGQLQAGDSIFVPAGIWHNLRSTDAVPLKLISIYAPPHHERGTVRHTEEKDEHFH